MKTLTYIIAVCFALALLMIPPDSIASKPGGGMTFASVDEQYPEPLEPKDAVATSRYSCMCLCEKTRIHGIHWGSWDFGPPYPLYDGFFDCELFCMGVTDAELEDMADCLECHGISTEECRDNYWLHSEPRRPESKESRTCDPWEGYGTPIISTYCPERPEDEWVLVCSSEENGNEPLDKEPPNREPPDNKPPGREPPDKKEPPDRQRPDNKGGAERPERKPPDKYERPKRERWNW